MGFYNDFDANYFVYNRAIFLLKNLTSLKIYQT